MLELTRIDVADIGSNPYRDEDHYPLIGEKLAALKASMEKTGFWENLEVRLAPKGSKFKYQIPYGHHRLAVLRQLGITHILAIVRDMSNEVMLQKMAFENLAEFGHSASGEQEIVRATIEAYAKGDIQMPLPAKLTGNKGGTGDHKLRFAPGYVAGDVPSSETERHPYTLNTLTEFLGWTTPRKKSGEPDYRIRAAVEALALVQRKIAKPEAFEGLATQQARSAAGQGNRVLNELEAMAEAKTLPAGISPKVVAAKVTAELTAGFRKANGPQSDKLTSRTAADGDAPVVIVSVHNAGQTADRIVDRLLGRERVPTPKTLHQYTDKFLKGLASIFTTRMDDLRSIVKHRDQIPPDVRRRMLGSVKSIIKELTIVANKLEGDGTDNYKVSDRVLSITDQSKKK
jgi:hypothetical protein